MSYTENKDALGLTAKTTPVDADVAVIGDSESPSDEPVKKITFANIRAWIEAFTSYFNVTTGDSDDITEGASNLFLTTDERAKVGYISVTQAVDLDQMELDIAALDAAVVLAGLWDASAGTFPGGGTAQAGASYIVSVGGTVGGTEFTINDRIVAITDNASTTVYAANWHKLDYTDAVLSVDGTVGAIDLGTLLFGKTAKTTPVDADTITITDSAASNVLKKLTFANLKTTLASTFLTIASKFTLVTPATDETAEGFQLGSFNAGATIAKFECVYMGASSKWLLTDASATATADKALAIALEAGTDTNPLDVALPGTLVRDDTWTWTPGGAIYLSETAGALTQTAPTTADSVVRVVGYAYSADVMYFMPETGVEHV